MNEHDNETQIIQGNILLACCADPQNLDRVEQLTPSLLVRYCRVCGRRHFEATADPGQMGLRGGSL